MSNDRLEGALNRITSPNGSNGSAQGRRDQQPDGGVGPAVGDRPALGWHRAHLQRRRRGQAARLVQEEHTLARLGAERLWALLHDDGYVNRSGR